MQHIFKYMLVVFAALAFGAQHTYADQDAGASGPDATYQKSGYQSTKSEWGEPPLSCLPFRAAPWDKPEDKPLCHCPPKSMCPKSVEEWNESPLVPPYVLTTCCNIGCPRGTVATITFVEKKIKPGEGAKVTARLESGPGVTVKGKEDTAVAEPPVVEDKPKDAPKDEPAVKEETPADTCGNLEGCTAVPVNKDTMLVPYLVCSPLTGEDCDKVSSLYDPNRDPTLAASVTGNGGTSVLCTVAEAFCMLEGTTISLANGEKKKIEDIKLGDQLQSGSGSVTTVEAVSRVIRSRGLLYSINGGRAFITKEHPILTKKGWKSAEPNPKLKHSVKIVGPLKVGDVLVTPEGDVEVKSIEAKNVNSAGGVTTYNMIVNGDGTFIADGLVVKSMNRSEIYY